MSCPGTFLLHAKIRMLDGLSSDKRVPVSCFHDTDTNKWLCIDQNHKHMLNFLESKNLERKDYQILLEDLKDCANWSY